MRGLAQEAWYCVQDWTLKGGGLRGTGGTCSDAVYMNGLEHHQHVKDIIRIHKNGHLW